MVEGRILFALAAGLAACSAGDWPQFRGPGGQGISDAPQVPVKWTTTENFSWKETIPGGGWSSPVLFKGRVYLTTAVSQANGEVSLRALCLDSHSGRTVWNVEVISAPLHKGHAKNSQASPTPFIDGERVYVHFGHYGTAALAFDGKVIWRNTSLKYSPVHGNGGSPAVAGDALVFNCDGASDPFVVALNRSTGAVVWKQRRSVPSSRTFSFSTPLVIEVNGRAQLISAASGAVFAYDPKDGRELWHVRYGEGYSVVPRPLFGHGLVYVCTGFDRPTIIAIRPDGRGDVTATHVVWKLTKGAPATPSPLLVGDELYCISDAGIMSSLDAKTGAVHWQERVGGNYSASPVYAAGKIFVQSEEGVGVVLAAGKEFQVLARNDLKEKSLASYAVDDGALFVRTEKHLYRIQEPVPADR